MYGVVVALGGTGYAAVTVSLAKNSEKLGGKPASSYLLKKAQPFHSTGLIKLAAGQTKTIWTLAGGDLKVKAVCTSVEAIVDVIAEKPEVYYDSNTNPVTPDTPFAIESANNAGGSDVTYDGSEWTTPKGDIYFDTMTGTHPGSDYHATCIFDSRWAS